MASLGRLDPGERVSVPLVRAATDRAVAHGTVVHLLSRPGLGLLATLRRFTSTATSRSTPACTTSADHPVTRHRVAGASAAVVRGPGHEVLGVREWRSGDDHRRVHWRSTARTGRLTVLERGDAVAAELRLVLVGPDDADGFEDVLSAAASVCDRALRSGRPVTAVAWHVNGPVLARTTARLDLLDWWSGVTDTVLPDPAAFGPLAVAGFGAGELLVAAPPETADGWFSAAGADRPRPVAAPPRGRPMSGRDRERRGAAAAPDRSGRHGSRSDRLPRCPRPAARARRGPRGGADRVRRLVLFRWPSGRGAALRRSVAQPLVAASMVLTAVLLLVRVRAADGDPAELVSGIGTTMSYPLVLILVAQLARPPVCASSAWCWSGASCAPCSPSGPCPTRRPPT